MRRQLGVIAVVCLAAAAARADDIPNPDQLKKAYDDALVQLKEAQNSKVELARENDRLGKQVEDLKKQLAGSQRQIQDLERQVADNDGKTFQLRSFYAAWQAFLRVHPDLMVRWKRYLGHDALAFPEAPLPLFELGAPIVDYARVPDRG